MNADLEQAIKASTLGKRTVEALYVHVGSLPHLEIALQEYVRQAQEIAGDTRDANIVKIHRHKSTVSFLSYPTFEELAHPKLTKSVLVNIESQTVTMRDYSKSDSPPILHRKECFVDKNHRLFDVFAELTIQEEKAGLYKHTSAIGTSKKWEELLMDLGYMISGHQLKQRGDRGL